VLVTTQWADVRPPRTGNRFGNKRKRKAHNFSEDVDDGQEPPFEPNRRQNKTYRQESQSMGKQSSFQYHRSSQYSQRPDHGSSEDFASNDWDNFSFQSYNRSYSTQNNKPIYPKTEKLKGKDNHDNTNKFTPVLAVSSIKKKSKPKSPKPESSVVPPNSKWGAFIDEEQSEDNSDSNSECDNNLIASNLESNEIVDNSVAVNNEAHNSASYFDESEGQIDGARAPCDLSLSGKHMHLKESDLHSSNYNEKERHPAKFQAYGKENEQLNCITKLKSQTLNLLERPVWLARSNTKKKGSLYTSINTFELDFSLDEDL